MTAAAAAPAKTRRRGMSNWLRFAISALLLAIVASFVDLRRALELVYAARLDDLLIALAICFADRFIAAYRWLVLLRARNPDVRFGVALRFIFISNFVGMFLPGGLEMVRIIGLSRATGDLALSFTSVLVERLLGLLTLLLIVSIGLIVGPPGLPPALGYWAALGIAMLVFGCGLLMSPRSRRVTERLMTGRLFRPIWTRMVKLYVHLDAYADLPKLLAWSLALALAMHAVRIAYTAVAAWALGIDVALVTLIVLVPIVFFVAQLPISIGGLGVREMTFVSLLGLAGIGIDAAFTLSLLLYVMRILSCLPAVLYYVATPIRYPEPISSAEQSNGEVDVSARSSG